MIIPKFLIRKFHENRDIRFKCQTSISVAWTIQLKKKNLIAQTTIIMALFAILNYHLEHIRNRFTHFTFNFSKQNLQFY
jgi:hypothetical protein